jgi:Xaa-Pro aminopeptidase
MDGRIIKRRIAAIRRVLSKKKLGCLIVVKPANVCYVTGFSGDDSWAVITPKTVYLVTDSRYTEQAAGECRNCEIIERKGPITQATAKIINGLKNVRTIGVESSCSIAVFKALQKKIKNRLRPAADIIEQTRVIKDDSETAEIKKAADIAAQALKKILKDIKAGISENELAGKLDLQIRLSGGKTSFETIVAFGPNASRPHHQPGNRILKTNDTVLIDFGAKYKGYCSDITRCFAVGRPDALYKKVYKAVKEAHDEAIKTVKSGVKIVKVDSAARKTIAKYDLPVYGHGTGHGLGLEIHEGPTLTKKIRGRLKTGMVCTIEPGVYIPGKLGVRIEDDVLVTKTACKILTRGRKV